MLGKSKSNKFLVMGLQGRTTGRHLPWSEGHERELKRAELDESRATHHCQWPAQEQGELLVPWRPGVPRGKVVKEGVYILVVFTLFSKMTLLNSIEFVTILEQKPRLYGHERE